MHAHTETTPTPVTPQSFGVGGRITLSVMSSDYVRVILRALAETDATGLDVQTDDVSTWVTGAEQRIAEFFTGLIWAAAQGGEHVSASVMFSRGCPGEVTCELPPGGTLVSDPPVIKPTGVTASAQWALYPLDDNGPLDDNRPLDDDGSRERRADHMRDIYEAIDRAKQNGSFVRSDHYVTRLSGDVAQIIETIAGGWVLAGRTVSHVTTHATISVNSPSTAGGAA